VCYTVIPELKQRKMVYQASSPDEAALVAGAEVLRYQFHVRDAGSRLDFFTGWLTAVLRMAKPKSVLVNVGGENREYEILNVCEFNLTRKRMLTNVRIGCTIKIQARTSLMSVQVRTSRSWSSSARTSRTWSGCCSVSR
jgi:phospholipid-transporting ATPase